MPDPRLSDADFQAVFEAALDTFLLLAPDAPRFTMLAANEARLRATMVRIDDVIGRPLFEVFQASLREVLRTGKPHRMPLQQYDIRKPDGEFEVLGNLVSNAIKYTPAGSVEITIGFRDNPASSARCVVVSVSDTGPGIPEEKRHLVFQEFVRLQPETTSGAGIGLTISRRVARALGGDITFHSEAGQRTTFTLWLPPPD